MTFFALVLSAVSTTVLAAPRDFAVTAAFQNDSLALPWTQQLNAPVHPGVRLGTEWVWLGSSRHSFIQSVALGYSSVLPVQRLLMLVTEVGYRFQFEVGVQLEATLVAGYGHEFLGSPAYAYQNSEGGYAAVAPAGRAQGLAGVALGLGFDARPSLRLPVGVMVRYESLYQVPFAPAVPVLPHVTLLGGLRWHL